MSEEAKSGNKLQDELKTLKEKIAILQQKSGNKAFDFNYKNLVISNIFEQIVSDSVIITDITGTILFVNSAAEKRLQAQSANLKGEKVFEFFPYHSSLTRKDIFDTILKKNQSLHWEDELNGRWYDNIAYLLKNDKGEPKAILELSRDITKHKHLEDEYKNLVEYSLQPLIIYQNKRVVYANHRVSTLFNCPIDVVYALESLDELLEYIHPEDRKRVSDIAWKHIERVTVPHRFELRMFRKDSKMIWLEIYTAFIDFRNTPAIQISFIDITDRKIADEAFRESEERFKIASILASDSIYEINLRNNQAKVYSTSKESELGTLQTEIMSLELLDRLIHPADRARIVEAKKRLHTKGEPFEEEYRLLFDNNKIVHLYSRAHLLRDEYGEPYKEIGVTSDITSVKQAREVILRERNLYLNGPLAALRWNNTGLWPIEYASQNIDQFGYQPEEFTSGAVPLSKLIHKDDFGQVALTIQKNTASGVSYFDHDYRVRHASGETRWVYDFTIIVRDASNETKQYESYLLDITDRKNIEEALKLSKERYSIAIEAGKVIVWDWDLQKDQRYTSSNINNILGLNQEKLSESVRDWNSYVHPKDREILIKQRMKCFDDVTNQTEFEYRIIDNNGQTHWMLSRVVILRDNQGKAYRMMGTDTEINQIKTLEHDLQKAKEIAEQANAAKIDFLANMSHDLRIPLNGILGYAQILKKDSRLPSSTIAGLEVIKRSGEHLQKLINDLLEFAKVEAGSIQPESFNFDLIGMLSKVNELLRISAQEKGLAFEFKMGSDLPGVVRTDEKILSQIIFNLLDNAIKYTNTGKVSLSVERKGDLILFFVADTGVGIPEENLELIFDPFRKIERQNKMMKGTGLGLTISKKFVEMLGGKLMVESELGIGSKFWFELDLPAVKNRIETIGSLFDNISGYKGEKKSVLIVDNIEENRSFLVLLFEKLGFECIEATNGYEAMEKALKNKPNLILMDLILPQMDGFETVEQIRKKEQLKKIKIIALTTGPTNENELKSLKSGFDNFLSKPLHVDQILKIVEDLLQLQWIYENKNEPRKLLNKIGINNKDLVIPPPDLVKRLYNQTVKGDLSLIRKIINEYKTSDVEFEEFIITVQVLIDSYEIKKLKTFLEKHLPKKNQ